MNRPSIFRVIIKDLIDFCVILMLSAIFTILVFNAVFSFQKVLFSLYFMEQFIELFFINHWLLLYFLFFSFFTTLLYFCLCVRIIKETIGAKFMRVSLVKKLTHEPLHLNQALLMGLGAYAGVLCFFIGPLYAWWLDKEHLGWSEKSAGVILVTNQKRFLKKSALPINSKL
jgi:hypothetical protein